MDACFTLVKRVSDTCEIMPLHNGRTLFFDQGIVDSFVENYGLKGGPTNPGVWYSILAVLYINPCLCRPNLSGSLTIHRTDP